jgi:hypothetical protein
MDVLAIPRTAVDRSLRVARLPLDATVAVFGRESDRGFAAVVMLDRADAAVRRFAGRVLHDEPLQHDADARNIAAHERTRAHEMRAETELRRRRADAEFRETLETADEERADAERRADQRRTRIDEERLAESRHVTEQAEQRKAVSRKAADRAERNLDAREQKARLEQLEKESDVLNTKKHSVTTASEAQRLQRAASEVKSKRKSG